MIPDHILKEQHKRNMMTVKKSNKICIICSGALIFILSTETSVCTECRRIIIPDHIPREQIKRYAKQYIRTNGMKTYY